MSLSRNQLGPDPDDHRPQAVTEHDERWVAKCGCGWKSGRRRTKLIAVDSLLAHIAERTIAVENVDAVASAL